MGRSTRRRNHCHYGGIRYEKISFDQAPSTSCLLSLAHVNALIHSNYAGAGKTSLFNVLAGRASSNGRIVISSNIRLGNSVIDPTQPSIRNMFAFVAQEDSLHTPSTPRQALTFSARLRLPKSTTNKQIDDLVNVYIDELGLKSAADTLIGGGLRKGISGGEKRRVSIGVELISEPSIIFLDEPTSGLDSFAARQVMSLLQKVADAGNIVLFTIHQPSSDVFASFDRLVLLNRGRLMYQGLIKDINDDFERNGYPVPKNYNPADWLLVSENILVHFITFDLQITLTN